MTDSIHLCPCCGQYEFPEEGSYEICPICTWEDDPVQTEEPDYKGGANVMSLNEAREAFRQGRKVS
ncbi:CPCC family cysteine-rich protein [Enterobacter cancerogenus]|uniref:CPCC family cysteine-rich protein n=1 Tax=Enterobacter cancerogenus TaxID=69218 RepID=UPI00384F9216